MICRRLSAFCIDELTLPELLDVELLFGELFDFDDTDVFPVDELDLLNKPVLLPLPLVMLGESERLRYKTGLSRLELDLGRLAVFLTALLQFEQYHTSRGSWNSASVITGR